MTLKPGEWLTAPQITKRTHATQRPTVAQLFDVLDELELYVSRNVVLKQHIHDPLGGVTLYCANPTPTRKR